MAKVFTITEGLENMGAIKTGGQGSVYKGKRLGEILTAIKILPTPIYSESEDDKNYIAFQNEVQKLKKVNEDPNPNVVKIISSGITDSGNFPFIEMEYIEGPDLEELLRSPHDNLFTIKEVLKVIDHLSCALAHCHKVGVRHGDIKSNNVKYNTSTGNYILLDFGLAMMSDEQRRTSMRHAGAIEFMAPEQNEGKILFQSDIYSFGVIIFELLTGTVPFPLHNQGETGRNAVMVAHLETSPPDIHQARQQSMLSQWDDDKRLHEMQIPAWVTAMVYKCLEKRPEDRFESGVILQEYTWQNSVRSASDSFTNSSQLTVLEEENRRLRQEKEQLQKDLLQYKRGTPTLSNSWDNTIVQPTGISDTSALINGKPSHFNIKKYAFIFILLLAITAVIFYATSRKGDRSAELTDNQNRSTPVVIADEPPEIKQQLQQARQFLNEGKLSEAFIIYSELSKREVSEAMYYYGKLALQSKNANISCTEAFELLKKASAKGYSPAKKTLGFIYSFADDKDKMLQAGYAERCLFTKNVSKGSVLLMEAMLQGDTSAGRFLDLIHSRQ